MEFTIVRPFNWIGPRMDFIPGIDGPSEGVPRVLACFSNVWWVFFASLVYVDILEYFYFVLYICFNHVLPVSESTASWATQACGWWCFPENIRLYKGCNWSCYVDDCAFWYTAFVFHFKFMFDMTVAEYCDPFLFSRKIPLEPMAIFLMWATLTMKLQLGSLQKWWLMWVEGLFYVCLVGEKTGLIISFLCFFRIWELMFFHHTGLFKSKWWTFSGRTYSWCELPRILWCGIWR